MNMHALISMSIMFVLCFAFFLARPHDSKKLWILETIPYDIFYLVIVIHIQCLLLSQGVA